MREDDHDGSFLYDPQAKSFRMAGFRWSDAPMWILAFLLTICLLTGLNVAAVLGVRFLNREALFAICGASIGYLGGLWVGRRRIAGPTSPYHSHDASRGGAELSDRVKAVADDPNRKIEAVVIYRDETGAGLADAKATVEDYIRHKHGGS